MELDQMDIIDKIDLLNNLLSRMIYENDYSDTFISPDKKDELIEEIKIVVTNASVIFKYGNYIKNEYHKKIDAINEWNEVLDKCIKMFPEYKDEKRYTKRAKF